MVGNANDVFNKSGVEQWFCAARYYGRKRGEAGGGG